MYSAGHLAIAVVDLIVLIWALRLYRKFPSTAQCLVTVPLGLMWFDNLTIDLSSSLREAQPLLTMNTVRFLAHYIFLPFTFVAIGSMAKQAGFK